MSPRDKSKFVARLKELRRLGYSPEHALRRATQEDAEALGETPPATAGRHASSDSQASPVTQKRDELLYEMKRAAEGNDAGAVHGIPGVPQRRTNTRTDGHGASARSDLPAHSQC